VVAAPAPPPAAPAPQAAAAPPPPPPPAPTPAPAAPEPAPQAAAAAVAVAEPLGSLDLGTVQELWPAVLQSVEESNQMVAMSLAKGQLVGVTGKEVTVAFTPDCSFQRKKAEDPKGRELVITAFRELVGIAPVLIFETREAEELGAEPEVISEDDFIARLRAEFDAVDHEPGSEGQTTEQEQA
jgi:hypothetical protein